MGNCAMPPSAPVPNPKTKKNASMKLTAVSCVVLLVLLIIVVHLILAQKREAAARARAEKEKIEREKAAKELEQIEALRAQDNAWKQTTDRTTALAQDKKYDEAVAVLEEFIRQWPSGKYLESANEEIAKAKELKAKAINEILADIRQKAAELAEKAGLEKAAELCSGYNGPFASETKDARNLMSKNYLSELKSIQEKKLADAEKLKQDTLTKIVECILAADIPGALSVLDKLSDKELAAQFSDIAKTIREVAKFDETLMDALSKADGMKLKIIHGNKPKTISLTGKINDDGSLSGKRQVGKVAATINFGTKDIPWEEKIRILNDKLSPQALALASLVNAVKEKNWDSAAKCIPDGTIISDQLSERLETIASDTREQAAANEKEQNQKTPAPAKEEDNLKFSKGDIVLDASVFKKKRFEGADYDDRVQKIEFTVRVANNHFKLPLNNYTLHSMIVGSHVTSKDVYSILEKKRKS